MKSTLCLLFSLMTLSSLSSQVGVGLTSGLDIYQRYSNADSIAYGSAGSLLANIFIGPKVWVGGEKVSLSLETQANIGLLGLAVKDYKGLGMVAFPIIARLNFQGLSGLDKEGKMGFSIGGGFQYNKTELYYLANSFEDRGVDRSFFRTYIVETAVGFGMSGFSGAVYLRYGFDPDSTANSFNLGLQFDFNVPKLKSITDPASEL